MTTKDVTKSGELKAAGRPIWRVCASPFRLFAEGPSERSPITLCFPLIGGCFLLLKRPRRRARARVTQEIRTLV